MNFLINLYAAFKWDAFLVKEGHGEISMKGLMDFWVRYTKTIDSWPILRYLVFTFPPELLPRKIILLQHEYFCQSSKNRRKIAIPCQKNANSINTYIYCQKYVEIGTQIFIKCIIYSTSFFFKVIPNSRFFFRA